MKKQDAIRKILDAAVDGDIETAEKALDEYTASVLAGIKPDIEMAVQVLEMTPKEKRTLYIKTAIEALRNIFSK